MYPQPTILEAGQDYAVLDGFFHDSAVKHFLLVCDSSFPFLAIHHYFDGLTARTGVAATLFNDFQPNPLYESVVKGVELFRSCGAEMIVAVGGGSAIDVAKCIKLYSNMSSGQCYLDQPIVPNDIPLLAVPTTAGTGSEATRFAVIYHNDAKQSVTHPSIIPTAVLMDPSTLTTLPRSQKCSTLLDALCHAIESFWSVNATRQSHDFSHQAISTIMTHWEAYLAGDDSVNALMLQAAHTAGKAINITQTTAGHAMCYKLTSLYGIAHGHAAALCVSRLWPWMLEHADRCVDARGETYLRSVFSLIADAMGCQSPMQAVEKFHSVVNAMGFTPCLPKAGDFEVLAHSVNPVRLKNNPVALDAAAIDNLYHQILS